SDFSIAAAFENFLTVQKFVPIAKSVQGNFGANLELVSDLDSTLTPVDKSLNSRGSLLLQNATVANFKPLDMAADILKMDKLKNLTLNNVDVTYKIRDGRFNLSPMNFKVENIEFMIMGSNGIDLSMDYTMKLKIPARDLTNETNARINNLLNRKVDLLQDDHVVFDVFFKGTVEKPDVRVSGSDIVKGVTTRLTEIAKQEIEQKKVMLADTVKSEIDKQKQVLEEMKKEAQQKAETEAEKLKKEAESQLKSLFKKKKK
ncbi:MAG TPA: AsmA-like C-terminal region-containing protein, partial [bacterium]